MNGILLQHVLRDAVPAMPKKIHVDNTRHERRRSKAHCSIFAKTMSTTVSALLQYGLS